MNENIYKNKECCSWCGHKHDDVHFNIDPKLSVCVYCIIKALDEALGKHHEGEST